MFRGTHTTRIDDKGRLKIPAEFKRLLDEKYSTQFYITSWDGKIAKIYPLEVWESFERRLSELSDFNPAKKKLLTRTNYYGAQVEIDGQGRVLTPSQLREAANLKGEVAVMGRLDHLEVRNADELKAELEQPFTAEDEATLDQVLGRR